MGSTLTQSSALIFAAICGAFFLLFDSLRFFVHTLGPVRIRRWSSDSELNGSLRWFARDPQNFNLLVRALLQLFLIAAVSFTTIGLIVYGTPLALAGAIIGWSVLSVVWKAALAFVSEEQIERLLPAFIPVAELCYYLLWPLVGPLRWILEKVELRREEEEAEEEITEEEVQAYIDVGEEEGIFEESEGRLIQSIVDFGDRIARELMTPRIDIQAFDADRSLEELAQLFSDSKYARIPIYEQTIDNVIGIVHIKDLFDAWLRDRQTPVRSIARPAYFVAETKNVSELLREFQIEHMQVAIVVDEYGGTAGLISVEDVVEEIVGEISDEHEDSDESLVELEEGVYLMNGMIRVELLEELFHVELAGDDYETIGGLIFTAAGRVPRAGESVVRNGVVFEVVRSDKKRVYQVRAYPESKQSRELAVAGRS
jgi:putative hemolysin